MIQNTVKRLFRKFLGRYVLPGIQFRYSQFGEDIIIDHLFKQLGIDKPSYLDIGANEAKYISNTYYFYEQGSRGVLVEPNPFLYKKLKKKRTGDIVLNTGVGLNETEEADFYVFPDYANGLSTFSKEEADHWQQVGMKGMGKIPLDKVIKMSLTPVNKILQQYFSDKPLNLVSLDVEGLDFEILKSMDLEKFRPDVICVETLQYDEHQKGFRNQPVIDFMLAKGYFVYADTRVNSIFCKNELFT